MDSSYESLDLCALVRGSLAATVVSGRKAQRNIDPTLQRHLALRTMEGTELDSVFDVFLNAFLQV